MFRLQSTGTSGEESDADYGEAHVGDIVMDADRLLQTRNEGVVLRNGKKNTDNKGTTNNLGDATSLRHPLDPDGTNHSPFQYWRCPASGARATGAREW